MPRIALPTGELRAPVAAYLDAAGAGIADYASGSRLLRFELPGGGVARVFRERDIPVQVALGQYDLGICSYVWVQELAQRYPGLQVLPLRDLGIGQQSLWLATAGDAAEDSVRIASEFPNIADAVARRLRLPRYRVFGIAGAAEAYAPEDADAVVLAAGSSDDVAACGLRPIGEVLRSSAWLIANKRSLANRDLSPLLAKLLASGARSTPPEIAAPKDLGLTKRTDVAARDTVRIALADGHNQPHTVAALQAAGIAVQGYGDGAAVRRPTVELEGAEAKVIRPQDMPQQVALGHFDLAITGRDILWNHLLQFPTSPVEEIADLGRSRYSLAIIVKDVPADDVAGAVRWWRGRQPHAPIRLAAELPHVADHFARERHFGRYSVIPVSGASEGFVPDDAEILIEGIETGSSVRANKLTVLERFFESTICVIGNTRRPEGGAGRVFDRLVQMLRAGAAQPVPAGERS